MNEIRNIQVTQIVAGNNDRKEFHPQKLRELADSIETNGLAQPPTLRPLNGAYQIVAGERRVRAMRDILGWERVPAIIRELDDETASAIMLVENTGRADLNPIEEALGYQERIERFGWTIAKIAQVAGVSVDKIHRRLRLLKLTPDIQHLVKSGQLPLGHAEMIYELDANRQRIALRIYNARNLNAARFKSVVDDLYRQQMDEAATPLFDLETYMVQKMEAIEAQVDAPTQPSLPKSDAQSGDTATDIIERYIVALIDQGHESEASAVQTLYRTLVNQRCL